jgi:ADP-heptose:LPS heptosyltransferase
MTLKPPKIMVIKHGALGDMVQALDGFACLRAGHPDAHLSLLTTAPFADFARAMPFFDEIIIDQRAKPWNLSALCRMRRLFRQDWKRIYDFQSSKRTRRYFQHLVPAKTEFVGMPEKASHPLPEMVGMNNRDRMVKTAEIGGCPHVSAPMDWLTGNPLTGEHLSVNAPYAVLIPGCSPAKPAKRWPAPHFASLAQNLFKRGITPVLAGTAVDRDAGEVIKASVPEAIDTIGHTNLMELASLLSNATLVVGNDTGPVFLAARLHAPTIMVMSRHTDPSMSAPFGDHASWIKRDDISTITADMVLEETVKVMDIKFYCP